MAYKLPDRVRMSITGTPGTGDVSLNVATAGFQTFTNSGLLTGDTFPYVIEDGSNWELGVGTYNSSGPSFARTTVRASSGGGTSKITAGPSAIVYSAIMGEDVAAPTTPALSGLSDVVITSLADGQVPTWSAADSKWENKTPTGGGGGGTAPTIVQYGAFTQSDAPCVMGATPTVGNLLLAIVSHYSQGAVTAGWTVIDNYTTGVSNDYLTTLYKVATSADTSSLSPIYATAQSTTIFEISGASDFGSHTGQHDITSTTPSLSLLAPAHTLIVGHFSTTSGAGVAPTSISGATQGTSATVASGVSGSPRTATPFYYTTTAVGGVTITATYATASNTNYAGVVVRGS
jgi:hypothetical protein